MNEENLVGHPLVTVSGEDAEVGPEKKFVLSQNLISAPYSNMPIGEINTSYSLAANNQTHNPVISLQQIKDLLLHETRKGELFSSKDRVPFSHGIASACTFPSVTEGLNLNLNIPPSQILNQSSHVTSHQVIDESSDLTSLINSAPRMTPHHEPFQATTINDSSPLLRGSMSCENSLSDLNPSITPVNLIDTSTDSLIFEKEVFSNDQTNHSSFNKESVINSVAKDAKENSNSSSNIVNSNRLLSKLIQSYKPESNTTMPLRIHDFAKIPNASLKPSLPNDINSVGKISVGSSPVPLSLHTVVSSSSHVLPLHSNLPDFSCRTSSANPVTNSLDALTVLTTSSSGDTYSTSNHVPLNSASQQSLQHLSDLNFSDHYENRVQQTCHQHVLNNELLSKPVKSDVQSTCSVTSMNKDTRFSFTQTRSEPLLITGDQLIQNNPITSAIESANSLNFIADQQILSHISHLNNIPTENRKEDRSLRPVDVFLSDLHASDDHDLLRGSLSNAIVPDMSSSLVSSTSPVVSETTLSTSIGSTSHLPELPPSPILANISPDFLVGGSSSVPKTSPGGQATFLPSLSTTTENLALSFSSHFLENSNMSIDMGSLSEGDASLNVPHSFTDSLDCSSVRKSSGHELTFTNALKGVTEKTTIDKLHKASGIDNNALHNFGSKAPNQLDNLSFKGTSLLTVNSSEIFKVPPQMKHSLSDDNFLSPIKRNTFSAKEIPLIKIDSESPPPRITQSPKGTHSMVQEVSCFKCQLCSYLSLDKNEINEHMKLNHESTLFDSTLAVKRTIDSTTSHNIKQETPPQPKRRKKTEAKKTNNKTDATSNKKKKKGAFKSQMKVEILPREKGGYQRSIILVDEVENTCSSTSTQSTSQSSSIKFHSGLISDNEIKSDSSSSEEKSHLKKEICFKDVSDISTPLQEHEEKSHCSSKVVESKSTREEEPKTFPKSGRPSTSQTMGIMKFKKAHPSIPIPEEALGIRCGVNGCGLRLKEQDNILYHRKCHVEAFLKCPECHAKFTHWASLAMHLWRLHMVDMELHKCDKCNFKSYSYTKLMNGHWKTHSTERPFLCDVCGKDFKTAKQLRSHKILHVEKNEELKHHCDMCQRKFAEKRMLLLHLEAVHRKVKPYLCNYCGNSFASKSTLNLHIRKHTGEKPFACESCSYRTSDHNSMRRHKMKHTNDRPYSCPYCDYSSIQSSTFKVHLRRKHEMQAQKDGVIFSCSMCPFKTVKKDNYLAHVGTHHKSSEDEQNKEAERQQHQIHKMVNNKHCQKEQNEQHQLEPKISMKQRVIATTSANYQQALPPLSAAIPNVAQHQQIFITKTQSSSSLPECSSNGQTTFLVANGNPKTPQTLSQQPVLYVFRELVPLPHVVNIDVNEEVTSEVSPELVNSVFLQSNMSNSRTVIVSSNPNDQYSYSNAGESVLQSVTINEGVMQLTPEVVAMPVPSEFGPLHQAMTSQAIPGLIYVTTSNETDNSSGKITSNSSLFS